VPFQKNQTAFQQLRVTISFPTHPLHATNAAMMTLNFLPVSYAQSGNWFQPVMNLDFSVKLHGFAPFLQRDC
jgi:hypothetical protein